MRALQQFRRQKDDFFRTAPESPISLAERAIFKGLAYFPPYFALRLVTPVERIVPRKHVKLATTDGVTRLMERYAHLNFTVDNTPCQLTAFRAADREDAADDSGQQPLFVPFRDALTGTQTYDAGRYLDLEEETADDGSPFVILDFNLAYNPYCAYSDNFSCPITPEENTLPIAIRAGERLWPRS